VAVSAAGYVFLALVNYLQLEIFTHLRQQPESCHGPGWERC